MKLVSFLPIAALPMLILSCAPSATSTDGYDVSNPYSAPDYADSGGTPFETQATQPTQQTQTSNVNPPYDAPAVYEAPATQPAASTQSTGGSKVHTVVRGDSLWAISKKYGVTVDSIKQANGLNSDVAVLGAKLQIPSQ